ncbi:MAG: hypothetical protein HQK49_09510 [Oligoflexia bacterium]|nr:hypothetical protein [Oligoflexia bacterium]
MKRYLNLFKAEGLKSWCEFKRYLFNTFMEIIVMYIIFLFMFYGIKIFAGTAVSNDGLDALVIGYIMWMFAITGFSSTSQLISGEMQKGTLEQLYLCPLGIEFSVMFRLIFDTIISFLFIVVIIFLTMLTTNRWLHIDVIRVIPILLISLPCLWGLGLAISGLILIFKKFNALGSVLTFGLIGAVSVPAYPLNSFSFIPFSAGAYTIQMIVRKNFQFNIEWYLFIATLSIFYFFIGVVIYKKLEKIARKKNLLGQY